MCPKVNFDWSNSEIGWKMANGQLLFCTLLVATYTNPVRSLYSFFLLFLPKHQFKRYTHTTYVCQYVKNNSYNM